MIFSFFAITRPCKKIVLVDFHKNEWNSSIIKEKKEMIIPKDKSGKRKILFPLDDERFPEDALKWAAHYLDNAEVSIYCLIVVKNLNNIQALDVTAQILSGAKTRFEHCGFHVVKSEFAISQKIPTTICDYANKEGIDQIVMGTHSKSYARMPLGSITQEVMKKARQPVLIIKNPHPPLHETDDSYDSAADPPPFSDQAFSLLIPVCDESTAEKLIPLLEGFMHKRAAMVHVLHAVVYDTENVGYINMKLNDAPRIIERNKVTLQKAGYWVAEAEYRVGEVVDVITKYAHAKRIDQIVLLSRSHTHIRKLLFGSVSTSLLKLDKHFVSVFCSAKGNKQIKQRPQEETLPLEALPILK